MEYQRTASPQQQHQQPQQQPQQQQYYSPVSSPSSSVNPVQKVFRSTWRSAPQPQDPSAMATPAAGDNGPQPNASSRKYFSICLAFAVITVPMILFPAVILYLVFAHRVSHGGSASDNLSLPPGTTQTDPGVYYVNFSATTLVFIASWSSTLALSLVSSVMLLYSYPVASRIMKKSERNQLTDLPTPYQLSVLVGLVNGGFGALWKSVKYAVGRGGNRPGVVGEVWWSMVVMVFGIFLSILISIADTWLHVTTKTVSYVQVSAANQPSHSFGRGLSSECLDWYQSKNANPSGQYDPCSLSIGASNIFLSNSSEAYQTVNNISTNNRVDTITIGSTYALLADPDPPSDIDFTAPTFAVTTQCTQIGQECGLTAAYGASTPFNCTNINFSSDLSSVLGWNLNFFNTSEAKHNATFSTAINPFYWALASIIDGTYNIPTDANIVTPVHGGLATILFCNTTIYDATYSQVNGTVTRVVGSISNGTVGGIFGGPINGGFGKNQLVNGMHIAAFSNTSQGLADAFATVFSQTTAGFAAGVMTPRPNTEEQTRNDLLVTSVPKAPLYVLVLFDLIYAVLGIVLAVTALVISGGGVADVQAKLSVPGLVAEGFERHRVGRPAGKPEEFFEEWEGGGSGRVTVQRSILGGWIFNTSARI